MNKLKAKWLMGFILGIIFNPIICFAAVEIYFDPIDQIIINTPTTIELELFGDTSESQVSLFYRMQKQIIYQRVDFIHIHDNIYQATLPAITTTNILEYYISAKKK